MIGGRYTLEREIGRGGSGVVHLARDEVLGRTVAIKRIGLMPGTHSPEAARAEREARIAAALNHPHVVSVFDLVEEDEVHWLVMEYVDGETLSQLLQSRGPLDSRLAASLIGQAADALADAHAAGIVHRDVKPSNILVTGDLEAKLSDFGIARSGSDPSLTQTGLVTGSPAYLAPEVASGATATSASDVWSLGATLFHALAGRPPYEVGDNPIGALYKIVHDDPPRLPASEPLAGLLEVTMLKDPTQRWSMSQVRDELRRVARGEAPTLRAALTDDEAQPTAPLTVPRAAVAPPASTPSRASRRPLGWIAAGVAGVAALAAIFFAIEWLDPGDGARPSAASTSDGSGQDDGSAPEEPSEQPASTSPAPRQQMRAFVRDYLTTVTSDPEAAFGRLTPQFQEASGGYEGFIGWWGTVESASPSSIQPDPEGMTVSYRVRYVMEDGSRETEQVRLQLTREGDRYLIAGEA